MRFIDVVKDECLAIGQIISVIWRKRLAKDPIFLLGLIAIVSIQPLLYHSLRGITTDNSNSYGPPSDNDNVERRLSLDLGGGNCKWGPPDYEVPEEIDFHKTLIAGFPSGDKRMIFVQMEALTGWRK